MNTLSVKNFASNHKRDISLVILIVTVIILISILASKECFTVKSPNKMFPHGMFGNVSTPYNDITSKLNAILKDSKCDTCPKLKEQTQKLRPFVSSWIKSIEKTHECVQTATDFKIAFNNIEASANTDKPFSTSYELTTYKNMFKLFREGDRRPKKCPVPKEDLRKILDIVNSMKKCPCKPSNLQNLSNAIKKININ